MPDVRHFDPDVLLDVVVQLFWRQGVASTGIGDVVATTGVSRSSLYATFGGKTGLYLAALGRYVDIWSQPVFDGLAVDGRGCDGIADFFAVLIQARCAGQHARWGCLVSNAHAAPGNDDPGVRQVLDHHHRQLHTALRAALQTAHTRSQLRPATDLDLAAETLALLAYGVNLRSRAGADPAALQAAVTAVLDSIRARPLDKEMT